MKHLMLFSFLLLLTWDTFSMDQREQVFLVLFNKGELSKIETSTDFIELNFYNKFQTRSYSGNSDAALMITIPNGNMDECQVGQIMVQINNTTWIPLEEIAFRIIDIGESNQNYQALLAVKDDGTNKTRSTTVRLKL
jgi:hypothetical protein